MKDKLNKIKSKLKDKVGNKSQIGENKVSKKSHMGEGKKGKLVALLSRQEEPNTVVNINIIAPQKGLGESKDVSMHNEEENDTKDDIEEELDDKDSITRANDKVKKEHDLKNAKERLDNMDYEPLRMDIRELAKKVDKMEGQEIVDTINSLVAKYDVQLQAEEKQLDDKVDILTGKRNKAMF